MKLQSTFRMWLARKQVQELKYEIYGPGMHHGHGAEGDDYDNINVQVMREQLGDFHYDDH